MHINLDNFDMIVLKNSSKSDLSRLDKKIDTLEEQLNQLRQNAKQVQSYSYPSLKEVKEISKKYFLTVVNINKSKEINEHRTRYNISFEGSIYNIVKFLKSFESKYISDIEQLTLQPNKVSDNKLILQFSILLK